MCGRSGHQDTRQIQIFTDGTVTASSSYGVTESVPPFVFSGGKPPSVLSTQKDSSK